MNKRKFHITENGFSMMDNTVVIPECYVEATGYIEAVAILNKYLATRIKTDDIVLITPEHRIDFEFHKFPNAG